MRKLLTFIIVSFIVFTCAYSQNNVSGVVAYKNLAMTPMGSVTGSTMVLLVQGNNIMYQTTTNNAGQYQFMNVNPGVYTLTSVCSKPSGGVNAVDALLMCTLGYTMTGLIKQAGDVNGSGGIINSADALTLLRFIVGLISNFQPPNVPPPGKELWVSDSFTLTVVNNSNINQNIFMLCTGDVNGSHIPPP